MKKPEVRERNSSLVFLEKSSCKIQFVLPVVCVPSKGEQIESEATTHSEHPT